MGEVQGYVILFNPMGPREIGTPFRPRDVVFKGGTRSGDVWPQTRLYLYHLSTKVGKQFGTIRSRNEITTLYYLQSFKDFSQHSLLFFLLQLPR
jgi:hypothetical protein